MGDEPEATLDELTARLRSQAANLRRAVESNPEDPRRRDAIVGLIACMEAPRRGEGKQEIRRLMAEALKLSAGQAPSERLEFLKRSFEAYAGELRHAGDERTAQIADRASGHCTKWLEAMLDERSELQLR